MKYCKECNKSLRKNNLTGYCRKHRHLSEEVKNYQREYIGCSLDELKQHLEKQFQDGMSWNNYGEWEVDHIYPLSLAKDQEDLFKLCHYTNLQPLWAEDNIRKGNRLCQTTMEI